MEEVTRVLFGKVSMYRAECPACGFVSLLRGGRTACCDAVARRPDRVKVKRESGGEHRRYRFPKSLRDEVLRRQDGRCVYCGIRLHPLAMTWNHKRGRYVSCRTNFDHFVPWVYSGNSSPDNVVAACAVCNRIKSSKVFDSFEQARLYVQAKRPEHGYSPTELDTKSD